MLILKGPTEICKMSDEERTKYFDEIYKAAKDDPGMTKFREAFTKRYYELHAEMIAKEKEK